METALLSEFLHVEAARVDSVLWEQQAGLGGAAPPILFNQRATQPNDESLSPADHPSSAAQLLKQAKAKGQTVITSRREEPFLIRRQCRKSEWGN